MAATTFKRGLRRAPTLMSVLASAGALLVVGCTTVDEAPPIRPTYGGPIAPQPLPDASGDPSITPPTPVAPATPSHLATRGDLVRAALLLPFSSPSEAVRAESASMFNAAELALFETAPEGLILIPKNTDGTPDGARAVARDALAEGADVILGPFFSFAVPAVAEEARAAGALVIAFSNDRSVAGDGVYLIDIPLEQEIERVVSFAASELGARKFEDLATTGQPPPSPGVGTFGQFGPYTPLPETPPVSFAVMAPDNAYGRRVRDSVEQLAFAAGGSLTTWEFYPPDAESSELTSIARRLARFDDRRTFEAAQEALAPPPGATPDPTAEPEQFQLPYDAVLLPERGVRLLSLAPLLPYYDVDPRTVQFIGTSLWNDPDVAREPALDGGWFPAPDPATREQFIARYESAYGERPSRLAGLAYDAVALVGQLTRGGGAAGVTPASLERPQGFRGAEGLFRFRMDGTSERALAILQIRRGEFVLVDPAPQTFATF